MNKKTLLSVASMLAWAAGVPSLALAQVGEEIIVTAQKQEQRIQDVPISITAYSGEAIRDLGLNSVVQLAQQTPSVTVGAATGEGGVPLIAIRGVSMQDYSDINESPSAVYVDEFYKAALFGIDSQVFDLERAEVLRGPQGTLFGRNATGGLIQFVTRKPTATPEGYVEAGFGEWNQRRVEAAVGGAIAGPLMGRISVVHEEFDGYTKNIFPGAKDGNFIDATAIRGQLLYDPGGASRASLLVQYGENEGENAFTNIAVRLDPATGLAVVNPGGADSAGYVDPTPGNLTDININQPGYLRTRQLTSILRLEHDFDAVKFVSISGFEASHKNMLLDTDAGPTFVRESMFTPRAEEWSQEVRLEHDGDKVDWVTGLYYFDYYVKGTQDLNGSSFVSASYRPMDYTVSTTSWAAFGNLNYALAPGLTTDLGVRFTNEKKQIGIYIPFTFVYTPAGASAGFGSFRYDESSVGDLAKHDSDNVSFNARLNWKPNEDTLIYGGVSRAFKGGAFNLGLFALPRTSEYKVKEEQLTSYEVGVHTDLGPVKLNGSAFYYDYKDYQAFLYDSATSSSRIFNTDASITGVELEAITHPFAGFDLSGSVTALDATLEGVSDKLGNKKDRKMALAPELSATLLARYSWAAPWGGEFSVQGDVVYRDSQYFDPLNSPALFEPSHTTADMRLAWANGQWKVALVGENITDEEYRNYVYDFSSNRYVQGMYARPSWFGVTLGYDFK